MLFVCVWSCTELFGAEKASNDYIYIILDIYIHCVFKCLLRRLPNKTFQSLIWQLRLQRKGLVPR